VNLYKTQIKRNFRNPTSENWLNLYVRMQWGLTKIQVTPLRCSPKNGAIPHYHLEVWDLID
jgi:hypothetical protein